MGAFGPMAGQMAQLMAGRGRPPSTGVSVPRAAPAVSQPQAPTVAARPVGRPGSAAPPQGRIRPMGPATGAGAPMGVTRGGAAPQRGFGGKLAQAMKAGPGGKTPPQGFMSKLMARFGGGKPGKTLSQVMGSPATMKSMTAPGGGPMPAAGGPEAASAVSDGGMRRISPQVAAGALGGWNANPALVKNAVNYLKGGAELAPAQRGSLDRVVRQTDQPLMRRASNRLMRGPEAAAAMEAARAQPGAVSQVGRWV